MRLQLRNRLYEHFFQQTELHPDDIEIDGQEVRIRTNDDLLGSSQASSSEEEDVEEEEEAMEPPPLPGVEDVIFDNEEEDSALKALAAGFEDMMGEDTGPPIGQPRVLSATWSPTTNRRPSAQKRIAARTPSAGM